MKKAVKCALAASILLGGLSSMSTKAAAAIDLMSNHWLVVLADTPLLEDYKNPQSIVGSIAGIQSIEVACGPGERHCLASAGGKDFILIKTWMGDKWIEDNDNIGGGDYRETEREITLVEEVKLYDQPDGGIYNKAYPPTGTLKPQKVRTTAWYHSLSKGSRTGRGMLEAPVWYRITTEQGEKWIVDPFIPEDMLKYERPSDRLIKLTGEELLYDYPYEAAGAGVKAAPGIVQVTASSLFTMKIQIYQWYKLSFQDGTFKWVKGHPLPEPAGGPLHQFDLANEKITLRTATRYFDIDGDSGPTLQNWLQPGSYTADKVNNGWARIETPFGWKVVNLDRAPLERPQGIRAAQETVKLTPETQTYYFPLTGQISHPAGTFTDQEAVSFEKWVSPEGVQWYHISTYSGIVWVPEKPLQD